MKAQTDPSDSELLQSMLAGDEEALAALYQRRQRSVYRFAFQMCGSKTVAEDVTQEVFMVLIREGRTFDASRGSVNAFLIGVARNHVLRRLRRERFYVAMELLQAASVAAARNAKFTPTKMSGQPVKVQGVLVYTFKSEPAQSQKENE